MAHSLSQILPAIEYRVTVSFTHCKIQKSLQARLTTPQPQYVYLAESQKLSKCRYAIVISLVVSRSRAVPTNMLDAKRFVIFPFI